MEESESDRQSDADALKCIAFCNVFPLEDVYNNIGYIYLIFVGSLLLLPCLAYAIFIKCSFPSKFAAVKWHICIFIINCSFWFVLLSIFIALLRGLPFKHGFFIVALPFLLILVVLTIFDMFVSPEGKYFRTCHRVCSTAEYIEMVRAALPSIKVNVKSLYREPMQKNLKINRPTRKMIVTAHRYFPIDGFEDESHPLPEENSESKSVVSTFHIKKIVEPGDDYSHKQFITFRTKFISSCQRNRGGQFVEDTVEMDIPGLEERIVTVNNNQGELPWWARRKVFYILSTLSFSIILRIVFLIRSRRNNITVLKKFFLYPMTRGLGGEEVDPVRSHAGYEEYQPFLAEEDCPPPYNPTIEWK